MTFFFTPTLKMGDTKNTLFKDFETRNTGADFNQQTQTRQKQILKNTVIMMSATTGIYVIRLSMSEVNRIRSDKTDKNDPLQVALKEVALEEKEGELDKIFKKCVEKLGSGALSSSLESMIDLDKEDKSSHSCIFLAFNVTPKNDNFAPELVGFASCSKFRETEKFSTMKNQFKKSNDGSSDFDKLKNYMQDESDKNYYYIDVLCSKRKGAGRMLILHAYEFAHRRKFDGLIALSFSNDKTAKPISKKTFENLEFEVLIEEANYKQPNFHGVWFTKKTYDIKGTNKMLMALCTRTGLTKKDPQSLIWRCPA